MIKAEKISDIFKLICPSSSNQLKPTRIILDLSEDGTFYNTKIYIPIIDRKRNRDKEYEGCIECKSKIPSFVEDFSILYDYKDNGDAEIFTITIQDEV